MADDKTIGLNAEVTGTQAFNASIASIETVTKKALDSIKITTDQVNVALKKLETGTQSAGKNLKDLGDKADDTGKKTTNLGYQFTRMIGSLTGMSEASVRASLALGSVVLVIDRLIESGIQGAKVTAVERGFERIVYAAQGSAQKLLDSMRTATNGMISDFELMQKTNILMTGLYEATGKSFVDHMGELLGIARAQAKLTGQDFNTVFSNLMEGLKRNEFHMLANIGISIRAEEVYKRYGATIGKTASELNAAERQQAALNEVLRLGTSLMQVAGNIQEDAADKYAKFMATLSNIANKVGQMFEPLAEGIYNLANSILGPLKDALDQIGPYIAVIMQVIGGFLTGIGDLINWILKGLRIGEALKVFVQAGAVLIGALATGILWAANNILMPVITAVAQAISDYLIGKSPPPKGPLSTIDIGGQKVMEAWLEGFTGTSLEPIDQVAAYVQEAMGNIAYFSREQVTARIKELDDQLNPFVDKLNLIKARFDALKEPIDAAFNALDRQLLKAVKGLVKGDEQAAATTRYLDMQKDALQGYVDAQQEIIDNQTLQVAMVKAQQAEERTLLDIRMRQLGPEEKDKKEKEDKAKKEKEKGGTPIPETSPAFTGFEAGQPGLSDWDSQVNAAVGDLKTAFNATGFSNQLDIFNKKLLDLQNVGKPKDGVKTLADKIKDMWGTLNIDEIVGSADDPNSPAGKVSSIVTKAIQQFNTKTAGVKIKSILQLSFREAATLGLTSDVLKAEIERVLGKAITDQDATAIMALIVANPNKPITEVLKLWISDTSTEQITTEIAKKYAASFAGLKTEDIVAAIDIKNAKENPVSDFFAKLISGVDPKTNAGKVFNIITGTFEEALTATSGDVVTAQKALADDLEKYYAGALSKIDSVTIASLAAAYPKVGIYNIVDAYLESVKDPYATAALIEGQITAGIGKIDWSKVDFSVLQPGFQAALNKTFEFVESNPPPSTGTGTGGKVFPKAIPFGQGGKGGSKGGISGITNAIQQAILGTFSDDFKGEFNDQVGMFVIGVGDTFEKQLDIIFAPKGTDNVFSRLIDFKENTKVLVLDVMLVNMDTFLADINTRLATLPTSLVSVALNPMLTYFNEFKNNLIKGINDMITQFNTLFTALNTALLGQGMPQLGQLGPMVVPDIALIGGALGGLFSGGFMRVGERGPEIVGSAEKIGVLPHTLVNQIDSILSSVTRVASMPTYAGSRNNYNNTYNNSNSRNMTNNFYGSGNANDIASKLHFMTALGIL